MRNLFVLVLACLLFPVVASAVADPNSDRMSIFFDLNADVYEIVTPPYVVIPVYVILTKPSFDSFFGYEFGYQIEGTYLNAGIDLLGGVCDPGLEPGNHIVGLGAPVTTSEATVLATLSIVPMDSNPIDFTLIGATPNSVPDSDVPAILLACDVIVPIRTSIYYDAPGVCAVINDCCPEAVDKVSWDKIRSLYR